MDPAPPGSSGSKATGEAMDDDNLFSLAGRVAVATGGNGIGLGIGCGLGLARAALPVGGGYSIVL